jgi:hypothetical protein
MNLGASPTSAYGRLGIRLSAVLRAAPIRGAVLQLLIVNC